MLALRDVTTRLLAGSAYCHLLCAFSLWCFSHNGSILSISSSSFHLRSPLASKIPLASETKQERTVNRDVLKLFLVPHVLLSCWAVLEAIACLSICQLWFMWMILTIHMGLHILAVDLNCIYYVFGKRKRCMFLFVECTVDDISIAGIVMWRMLPTFCTAFVEWSFVVFYCVLKKKVSWGCAVCVLCVCLSAMPLTEPQR